MTLEFQKLSRDDYQSKFERWVQSATGNHPELQITPNDQVAWSPLAKPLHESTVALLTTAGVRRRDDTPFSHESPWGDPSYRVIPSDVDPADLVSDEIHLDTEPATEDINCLFPLGRLTDLAESGAIGAVAPNHYSILGFLPDPERGLIAIAREIATAVADSGADIALLTPG